LVRNIRIVPAILTDDTAALRRMVQQMKGVVRWAQVDIMDGEFVPSKSVGWQEVKAAKLPFGWEAHLMVVEPDIYFSGFKSAGARRVVFHYEATDTQRSIIENARKLRLEVGMAINPGTPIGAVADLLPLLDSVLLLSVVPGFYGAKFIPEVLSKIGELRALAPDLSIGVDGGIKDANIIEVASSGVDDICVGSGIFLGTDPAACYRHLQAVADAVSG